MRRNTQEALIAMKKEIVVSDTLIYYIDTILLICRGQKDELVKKRAELKTLELMLCEAATFPKVSKGATDDAILGTAATIGLAATGNVVGAVIAGSRTVNKALDDAMKSAEEKTRKIEEELEKQKNWKKDHPGKTK